LTHFIIIETFAAGQRMKFYTMFVLCCFICNVCCTIFFI